MIFDESTYQQQAYERRRKVAQSLSSLVLPPKILTIVKSKLGMAIHGRRHNIHLKLSADSSTGATSHSAAATSFPSLFAKVKLNLINDHEMAMVDIAEVPGQLERRTEEQSYIRPWTAAFNNALHRGLLTDPGWLRSL